jgi:hypothetical protein
MKLIRQIVLLSILGSLLIYLLLLNFRLLQTPTWHKQANFEFNGAVLAQLQHLKVKLHQGEAERMQQLYPEGFIFLNVLYGLTWADFLKNIPPQSQLFQQGIQEIDWVLQEITQESARLQFGEHLPLPYGAFYNGWTTYLLGKKLKTTPLKLRKPLEVSRFKGLCQKIAQSYNLPGVLYLESYSGGIWPADNLLCIASLQLHDQLFTPQFAPFIQDWLKIAQSKLDPFTKLLPHAVSSTDGKILEGSRGSSMSLMLCFLPEIDKKFAQTQFENYQTQFLSHRLGLPGLREYPLHRPGIGDIDSGPVIWGIGGAASLVGIRAFALNQNPAMGWQIRNCVEGFGFPITWNGQKFYILDALPIADAFIAWSNGAFEPQDIPISLHIAWFFHTLSLLLFLGLSFLIWRIVRKK